MGIINNLKTNVRVIGAFAIVAFMILVLVFNQTGALGSLQSLQNNSARTMGDLVTVNQVGTSLVRASRVIAGAEINGDLATSRTEWVQVRQEMTSGLDQLAKRAEKPDDKSAVQDATAAFAKVTDLFENRMLPALDKAGAATAETRTLNAQIDTYVTTLAKALDQIVQSRQVASTAGLGQFAATRDSFTQTSVVVGLIGALLAIGLGVLLSRSITRPLGELVTLVQEMSRGHLSRRLDWQRQDEFGALATSVDQLGARLKQNLVGPLNKIAVGELDDAMANISGDAGDEIAPALQRMVAALQDMMAETNTLTAAAAQGQLATRGQTAKFQGSYRKIVQGINDTLDAVIGPMNVSAEYIDRISKGDIPVKITDSYRGDFNEIKNNLNALIDTMNRLTTQTKAMYDAHAQGEVDASIAVDEFTGTYQAMAAGMNQAVLHYVDVIRKILAILGAYAEGDFTPVLEPLPGKQARANEKLELLRTNLRAIVSETSGLTRAAVEGKLATRANANPFNGEWRLLVQGLNDTLDAIVGPLKVTATYLNRISKGDIPAKLAENYRGDYSEIETSLNAVIDVVHMRNADLHKLAEAAVAGRLEARADVTRYTGENGKMVAGVNAILDAVSAPLQSVSRVLGRIGQGDLNVSLDGNFVGDYAELKNGIEAMVNGLRSSVDQTQRSAVNLTSATADILASSTQMASTTREQASAVNEITSTVQEIKASAEQVAQQAQSVANEASQARAAAEQGTVAVQETISGMSGIRQKVEAIAENILALSEQTQQIGDIIDTVSDIAGQSNILALNAAIEAAQAGEAGKGFRVVADEVRSLAEQSRQAAAQVKVILGDIQKATNLAVMATEQGTKEVNSGSEMVNRAARTINELSKVVEVAAQSAQQIVAGVEQQTIGLDQIVIGMSDINQAAQQSAQGAQQSQRAAQGLTVLAEELKQVAAQYRI